MIAAEAITEALGVIVAEMMVQIEEPSDDAYEALERSLGAPHVVGEAWSELLEEAGRLRLHLAEAAKRWVVAERPNTGGDEWVGGDP